MRRFSQRNSLVTLSDINITPLLDLAFVLLIIFIITTPLLENGMALRLPSGPGSADQSAKKNLQTVEVSPQGNYVLNHRPMKSVNELGQALEATFRGNPEMIVYIRADENGRYRLVTDILNQCRRIGITRIAFAEDPQPRK